MVEVRIDSKPDDVRELSRIMSVFQQSMRKTPTQAVNVGGFFVARALQAASKISPKSRKVKAMRVQTVDGKRGGTYKGKYLVENRGKWIPLPGYYGSIAEARNSKAAKIFNRGLARLLWWKMATKVSQSAAPDRPQTENKTGSIASRAMWVSETADNDGAKLAMIDKLKYASQAFRTQGRATVDNAMRRASNAMRKYVERETGTKIRELNK